MKDRFRLRTIFIPLGAVAGFYIIQAIIASAYMLFISVRAGMAGDRFLPEEIESVFFKNSNQIGAVYSVIIIIGAIAVLAALRSSNKDAVRLGRPEPIHLLLAVLAIFGVSGLVNLQMTGLYSLGQVVPWLDALIQNYIELAEAFTGNGSIPMIIISTCILVPISEELVFRGIIQGELRRAMPAWAAIVIQAVIFALVHGDPIQISYVILPALILGAVYEWTGSIYVPITLHMLFNFVGAALPEILGYEEEALMYMSLIQLAFIPIGVLAFLYLRYIRKTYEDEKLEIPEEIPEPKVIADTGVKWVHRDL